MLWKYQLKKSCGLTGKDDAAESILSFAFDVGSTIRSDYELLAILYGKRRDYRKLDALIARAELLDSPTKVSLLASLNAIKEQAVGTQNPDFNIDMLFDSNNEAEDDTTRNN